MANETLRRGTEENSRSWSWRSLLKATALGSLTISAFGAIAFEPDIPIVTGVLVGIGLLWLLRPGKGAVIYMGVIHLLIGLVVLLLFQLAQELAYPASWMVFVTTGARLVATITAIVAAGGALLGDRGRRGPRVAAWIAILALMAFVAVGITSRLLVRGDTRQAKDLVLKITPQTAWSTRELRVKSGTVSIYVENDDVHHGNFTIDGLVSLDIPAGTAKRTTFNADPGSYRYYSKLYRAEPEMRGNLVAF